MDEDIDELQLFRAVWPDGMPHKDRLAYEAVSPKRRPAVLKRLKAVYGADRGADLTSLAAGLNLKRAAFYNLRMGWRRHSIAGIIPYETRSAKRLSVPDEDPLRRRARVLLRKLSGRLRNVDVARRLLPALLPEQTEGSRVAALQRAERVVQYERRALASDPKYLRRAYGRGLIIEITGVNVLIDEGLPTVAVVAFVIEMASGLILGNRIGLGRDACGLERNAIAAAIEFLRMRRADRSIAGNRPDCVFTLPPEYRGTQVDLAPLRLVTCYLNDNHLGHFGYGQHLAQTVGPRIGRLGLAPRRELFVDPGDVPENRAWPSMTMFQAEAFFANEVGRHNEPILVALAEAGLLGGGGEAAADMAAVLIAAARVLDHAVAAEITRAP